MTGALFPFPPTRLHDVLREHFTFPSLYGGAFEFIFKDRVPQIRIPP
jgi:hypothetical protein